MLGQFAIGTLEMRYLACERMVAGHVASDLANLHVAGGKSAGLDQAGQAAWMLAQAIKAGCWARLACARKPESLFGMHEIGQAL